MNRTPAGTCSRAWTYRWLATASLAAAGDAVREVLRATFGGIQVALDACSGGLHPLSASVRPRRVGHRGVVQRRTGWNQSRWQVGGGTLAS